MKRRRAAPKDKKAAEENKDDSTDTKISRDANKCIVSDV